MFDLEKRILRGDAIIFKYLRGCRMVGGTSLFSAAQESRI